MNQLIKLAATGRSAAGLLLFVFAQVYASALPANLLPIHALFNNGHFDRVVERAPAEIARARKINDPAAASEASVLLARSYMQLERYDEAAKVLDEALSDARKARNNARTLASVYLSKATLSRFRRDFPAAISYAREALATAPNDQQVKLEHHLAIGRTLYSSGYDIAAIVWLEKAEKLFPGQPGSSAQLDVLGRLSLAWKSKLDYAKSLAYAKKLVEKTERTEFKYRYRLALYELADLLNAAGQDRKAKSLFERGLRLAVAGQDDYQSCMFLSALILNSLYKEDIEAAERHLQMLGRVDRNKRFLFESLLGKAVIAASKGQQALSEQYFQELASMKSYSAHFIPYWRSTIAERKKDWKGLIEQSETLRRLSEEANFREDLPGIYLSLAKGHWGLGKREPALDYAERSAAMIAGDRPVGDAPLSLSLLETYHSVYRLLAEIEEHRNDPIAALRLADYSKGRVLRDRIENSPLRRRPDIGDAVRKHAEDLSVKLIDGVDVRKELATLERSVTLSLPERTESKLDLESIESVKSLESTAIVSFFFTLGGELRAYVIEKGRPLRIVKLALSDREADVLARSVRSKIRDRIFFKKDGKEIYDRLLAPLSLKADHLVIVPDKSLWNIPFHALSPDGKSYLIEQNTISYSPSVSLLLEELKKDAPIRKTIQVFANDSFENRYLPHVNREAGKIARMFGTQPATGATRQKFLNSAGNSDILHFSMHAQADSDEPLESFLAFKAVGRDMGRITVEDLLQVRLKSQNLAFLASCETHNVLNGEGLVSLAWALLGSRSSSVVSAQWEANDRSTEIFTEKFYKQYREGMSSVRAMQSASIAMIRNKTSGSHEPYFWAAFFLLGDYR